MYYSLQQEWVQMDWYLTMINMKQKGVVKNRVGDGITLPIEFFHHYLGRFLTKDINVIPIAANQKAADPLHKHAA